MKSAFVKMYAIENIDLITWHFNYLPTSLIWLFQQFISAPAGEYNDVFNFQITKYLPIKYLLHNIRDYLLVIF